MEVQIVSTVAQAKDQFMAIAMSSSLRCGAGSPARLAASCGPLLRDSLARPWVLRPASWLCARVTPVPASTSEPRGCGYLAVLVSHTLGALRDPVVRATSEYQDDYSHDREWVGPAWRISSRGLRAARRFCVRDVAGGQVVQIMTSDPSSRRGCFPHRRVDCGMGHLGVNLYDCNSKWVVIVGGPKKNTLHLWKVPASSLSSLDLHGVVSIEDLKEVDIAESLETGVLVSRVVAKWDWEAAASNLREKKARVFWSGLLLTDKNELLAPSGDVVVTLPSKPWLVDQTHFACIADSTHVHLFKLSQPTQPCSVVSLLMPDFPIDRVSGGMGSLVTFGMTEKGASNALVVLFCDPWSGTTVLTARFLPHQITDTLDWSSTEVAIPPSSQC
ncbi:hypothetical protein Pelo_18201 [Pelomyxa schiedti]|nr:hypothetical protein Pelo_18201 [Pelomyxa schiedti]